MLENMTKEELIAEVKKMQEELYHLRMSKEMNISPSAPRPDGYAAPATRPTSEAPAGWALPEDRSGQIPSAQDSPLRNLNLSKVQPWMGAVMDTTTMPDESKGDVWLGSSHGVGYRDNNPHSVTDDTGVGPEEVATLFSTAKEKIEAAVETIIAYQKEAEAEDKKEYSGWCLRITDFEGEKFMYLKSPDDRSMSLLLDYRDEVNGVSNRPQVISQLVNVLGTRDIPGVWPRWWKVQDTGEWFVISRHDLSYTISPKTVQQQTLLRDFFAHLNTVRVPSIDEEDGA